MTHGEAADSHPRPARHGGKVALRDQLLTARGRLTVAQLGLAARQLADVALAVPEVRRAATVAAYVGVGTEPGTTYLLDGLLSAGKRVLLPVLLPNFDLDWAPYAGPTALRPGRFGLLEPMGTTQGVTAISWADLVLVPGLAMSASGDRLGRGGGSYDRALARVPVGTPVWVVLYNSELGQQVPVESHDRPVTGALSPGGVHRL